MTKATPDLLNDRPAAREAFRRLKLALGELGPYRVEEKKSSLHIVAGRAAFLGVHPRSQGLRLNIVLGRELEGARVVMAEKTSSKVWHNEVDVFTEADFDGELRGWLREAYARVTAGA